MNLTSRKRYKNTIAIIVILGVLFCIFWVLLLRPFVHKTKNDVDHSKLQFYMETVEHPLNTEQLYYTDFFGNSSGSGNHCEHIFLEVRKYMVGNETIIKHHFNTNYPNIRLHFITSLEQCCQSNEKYYIFCDYTGNIIHEQPIFTKENQQDKLPVYSIEYSTNSKHLGDKRCY